MWAAACAPECAHTPALSFADHKASIDHSRCVGCGRCIGVCPQDAIHAANDESVDILNRKIAEYTKAVVDGRPCFHISLVMDVSPNCDCHAENDAPIVPNVGMFASFDPVALDQACADAVNAMPINPHSVLATRTTTTDMPTAATTSISPIRTPTGGSAWSTRSIWAWAAASTN